MEYKRYYNTHLIGSPSTLDGRSGEMRPLRSYLVRLDDPEGLKEVLGRVFRNSMHNPFSVTIDLRGSENTEPDARYLNLLCDLFCHPLYYKKKNQVMLGILCPSPDEFVPSGQESGWQRFFISQGFVSVSINPIGSDRSRYYPEQNCLVVTEDGLEDTGILPELTRQMIESGSVNTDVFFLLPHDRPIPPFDEIYGRQMKQSPAYFAHAIDAIYNLSKEVDNLREVNAADGYEIASLQAYNDFLLRLAYDPTGAGEPGSLQNEAVKIRNFYYTEYEILPLWYKRFGHILKVLMGKRTFKSLFNDNVPKYINKNEKD